MKKFTLLLSLLFAMVSIQAQDYLISFAGTGASSTIGTVTVENLTQGKSISLLGTEVLHLVATGTGIDPILDNENTLRIYPNPTTGNSTIEFVATAMGAANIELYDITGKRIGAEQNTLAIGTHSYQVSGLRSGIYTIRIYSQSYSYTSKLVSNGASYSAMKISYIGNSENSVTTMKLKSASTETTMQYTAGDLLKFTSTSGNYTTITTDIPTQSKKLTFSFVACTDGDGNNYPVVQIGHQVWMVENLKTTKYRNGDAIPTVTDNTAWSILTTGAYCNYNNDAAIGTKYGKLYNWYAVADSRNIAPAGWHVALDAEWTTLETADNKYFTSGSVAKALASTTDWASSTNFGAIGNDLTKNNTTGFTALPVGFRGGDGSFVDIGDQCGWWGSPEDYSVNAWFRSLDYDGGGLGRDYIVRSCGISVRCVRDL